MWIKTLIYRIGVWAVASLLIFIGHFHLSLFILASFSLFFKELVQLSRVLQKEERIQVEWLDLYWYLIGAYICIPKVFLREKILG